MGPQAVGASGLGKHPVKYSGAITASTYMPSPMLSSANDPSVPVLIVPPRPMPAVNTDAVTSAPATGCFVSASMTRPAIVEVPGGSGSGARRCARVIDAVAARMTIPVMT
jgi:hypothetical protein